MLRNKTWYFLLYLLSFCISTGVFHAVANAQEAQSSKPEVRLVTPVTNIPTPTIFVENPIAVSVRNTSTTTTPTPSADRPTDSPVIVEKEAKQEVTPIPLLPTATPLPTAIPSPIPTSAPVTDLESMFDKYSGEYGVAKELLKKIAKCESGFNPTSNNSGMYLGMFQFSSSTWVANRNRMGMDSNPELRTNAEESIRTAAYVISKSGPGAWPNCH